MWHTQVISVGILATVILITTIEKGCCRVLLNLFSTSVANVATKLWISSHQAVNWYSFG